jgi:hypothetical protein
MAGQPTSPHHELDATPPAASRALPHSLAGLRSRQLQLGAFALIVALGVGVQLWAALQWRSNLDGDESIFGLIAYHMLAGRFSAYAYGQGYLGTLEPALAAGLMWLFGTGTFLVRLPSALLFGIFLALFGALVRQIWGLRVALISLLLLALPGRHMLHWTYRPITDFGPMAVCGVGTLLLAWQGLSGQRHYLRVAAIGLLAGLGIWSQPLAAIYLAVLALVCLLSTPEWRAVYERLARFCERVIQIPARELLPAVALGIGALAVLVLFTGACEPAISYQRPRQVATLLLLGAGAATLAALAWTSPRRRGLFGAALLLAFGFVLGNAPQWGAWLFGGTPPRPAIYPACPTDAFVRLRLALREVYPLVWGLPFWTELREMTLAALLPWLVAAALALTSLTTFVWANRASFWSLLGLAPLPAKRRAEVALGLLFAGPVAMILLGGNTFDWTAVRYLLIAWQAAAIIMALFLARISLRWPAFAAVLLIFWIIQVGAGNLGAAARSWESLGQPYAEQPLATLRGFMEQHGARGGYADYWTVYTLRLASEEQLLLAPYNGVDRIPDDTRRVEAMPVQAYLLRPGLVVPGRNNAADLAGALFDRDKMGGTGPAFARFRELLRDASVLDRQTLAGWDVWIVKQDA